MNERVRKLTEEIRKLSPEEQAELVEELLVLAQPEPDPEIQREWAEEAARRWRGYQRTGSASIPAEEVFAKLGKRRNRASEP